MSFWQRLKQELTGGLYGSDALFFPDGTTSGEKDTLTVIRDLSRVVMGDPDAVELYMALGNLYRSRGDTEKAVQIRESLLVRPELPKNFRANAYFELGQDYRRAGLIDRAVAAYAEAEKLGYPLMRINAELAEIWADSGEWEKASRYFAALGNKAAEAHYMIRLASETLKKQPSEPKKALKIIHKAVKTYPASPEAWAALIVHQVGSGKWTSAARMLVKALNRIDDAKSFMLLEELAQIKAPDNVVRETFSKNMLKSFIPVLEHCPPRLDIYYYGARLLRQCNSPEQAEKWISKALVLQPDFWAARLEQMEVAHVRHKLSPALDTDVEFFITASKKMKKFYCRHCGLELERLFYFCPRCHSWHSASFKIALND